MKTVVFIPEALFRAAKREARRRGISRSKLHQLALEELIRKREQKITDAINRSLALCPESEEDLAWINACTRQMMERITADEIAAGYAPLIQKVRAKKMRRAGAPAQRLRRKQS